MVLYVLNKEKKRLIKIIRLQRKTFLCLYCFCSSFPKHCARHFLGIIGSNSNCSQMIGRDLNFKCFRNYWCRHFWSQFMADFVILYDLYFLQSSSQKLSEMWLWKMLWIIPDYCFKLCTIESFNARGAISWNCLGTKIWYGISFVLICIFWTVNISLQHI